MPINERVRQGDTISSKLLTACSEEVFKNFDFEDKGIKIDYEYLNNLLLVDDVVLLNESKDNLLKMIEELKEEFKRRLEDEKTKKQKTNKQTK